jgi:hypothetical protein
MPLFGSISGPCPALAAADIETVTEIAAAMSARWPVDALVLYGSKARGDDTPAPTSISWFSPGGR